MCSIVDRPPHDSRQQTPFCRATRVHTSRKRKFRSPIDAQLECSRELATRFKSHDCVGEDDFYSPNQAVYDTRYGRDAPSNDNTQNAQRF